VKKLKAGIIGCGAIGKIHADAYAKLTGAEVTALADSNEAVLQAEGKRLGVKRLFTDYRELLKTDVNAVDVCTPNTTHCPISVDAFAAGKHVLLEKPMAMNSQEAQQIVDAAVKAKKVLQIGMVWRQSAAAEVLREYVEKGLCGEIYHIRTVMTRRRGIPGLGGWFTTKAQSGGGPMIDLGVHWFDLSMWLSGHWNPTLVSAQTYAKFGPRMENYNYVGMWAGPPKLNGVFDVEDYATGFVRFGGKATMSFEISWAQNAQEECFVDLLGSDGGARITGEDKLTIFTEHEKRIADITPYFTGREGMARFVCQVEKFIKACSGHGAPAATGPQGVTVMKLIDTIYQSSQAGHEVAFGK